MILNAIAMGEGRPAVLLHGLFGQARNFGFVQRRLAGPNRRVIALDLRNHGASPHAPGMHYRDLAADVIETLGAMGALPAAFIGHSMGGKVAMAAALTAPEAVARLMVADIAPTTSASRFTAIIAAMQRITLTPDLTRAEADHALAEAEHDPAVRAFLLQNLRFGATPAWRVGLEHLAAGLPDILDWPDFAATYEGPTLFLAGDRSDYIQPEHRPIIRALFPRVRMASLRNAGHWLHADNPEGFIAVADAFLTPQA